jgi:hypothetical protein
MSMSRRVAFAISATVAALAVVLIVYLPGRTKSTQPDTDRSGAVSEASHDPTGTSDVKTQVDRPVPNIGARKDDVPVLARLEPREGEDTQVYRGRVRAVENYRTAVDAASLTPEEERQVRRILADAQQNRAELEQVQKEVLSEEPERFEERMQDPVALFNAEVDEQLLQLLGKEKRERFKQKLGSYSSFVFFLPFDVPTKVELPGFPVVQGPG